MSDLASLVLIFLFALCCVPTGYLYLLLLASFRTPAPRQGSAVLRFAVVISAYNEERVISDTIHAIRTADYPAELVDIFVVADHCDDRTAEIARSLDARVYERLTTEREGKGSAIGWLFDRIFNTFEIYDAVAILDADTHVDPQFFKQMSARMNSGARVVQGNHIIQNPKAGWFPALTWAMFMIDNRIQNQGRDNLGLSAKNMGDSICIEPAIIQRLHWGIGLTDDYSFRQKLLFSGIRIEYEHNARGYGEAARNWIEARKQRSRWLLGTYLANQQNARKMLVEAFRRRNPVLLDGALQAYLPAYSTLSLFIGIISILSWVFQPVIFIWLPWCWTAALALMVTYPFIALAFDRSPLSAYLIILTGPAYIFWRTFVAISTRFLKRETSWERTRRQAEIESRRRIG